MPKLSLLTAILPEMSEHIGYTDRSVQLAKAAVADVGWTLEWIVAVDGPGDIPDLPDADRVLRLPKKSGVSAARNYALATAVGDWIAPLDGDDTLEAAGVVSLVEAIHPGEPAQWIAANRLHMDGSRTPYWRDQPASWNAGDFAPLWSVPFPVHPNSILVRREFALAGHGWPATPTNEDVGFVLTMSERGPGRFATPVLTRYRLWEGQTIASPLHAANKVSSFAIIEAIVNAQRLEAKRAPITAPQPRTVYTH